MPLWLAFVGAVGATFVLTFGSVFEPLRAHWPGFLGGSTFIRCALCVGVWVGAGSYFLTAPEAKFSFHLLISAIWFGAAVGTLALLVRRTIDALDVADD